MSEQGIERARSQVAWAIERADDDDTVEFFNEGDPADSSRVVHVGDIREAIATPPVPAGEVGELVERLSYLGNAIENEFNPTALGGPSVGARECGKPMLDAAALLERYAAALDEAYSRLVNLGDDGNCVRAALSSPSSLR